MKTLFRSGMLMATLAFLCSSCELIPDEVTDIFEPDLQPQSSCELVEIRFLSDLPEQSFTFSIDSIGSNEVTFTTSYIDTGEDLESVNLISPDANNPNIKNVINAGGTTLREVEVDEQNRLKRVTLFSESSSDANLESTVISYNYDKLNVVEATLTSDSLNYKTIFEYSLAGNLIKVSTDETVIIYEYGSIDNKLYNFEKAYVGLGAYSPITGPSISVPVPIPSRKLPSKQVFETNTDNTDSFTWTINSQGYPTMLEILDGSEEIRKFEYGYENCESSQNDL